MKTEELRAQIRRAGRATCRIVSDSMTPFLKVGEEIEIVPFEADFPLRRFDLVVYETGGRPFCHYFWRRNPAQGTYSFRCLRAPGRDDAPVRAEQILGVATGLSIPWWHRCRAWARVLRSGSA